MQLYRLHLQIFGENIIHMVLCKPSAQVPQAERLASPEASHPWPDFVVALYRSRGCAAFAALRAQRARALPGPVSSSLPADW